MKRHIFYFTLLLIAFFELSSQSNYLVIGIDTFKVETEYYSYKTYQDSELKVKIKPFGNDSFPAASYLDSKPFVLAFEFVKPQGVAIDPILGEAIELLAPYQTTDTLKASRFAGITNLNKLVNKIQNAKVFEWDVSLSNCEMNFIIINDTMKLMHFNPQKESIESYFDSLPNCKVVALQTVWHPKYWSNEKKLYLNNIFWEIKNNAR